MAWEGYRSRLCNCNDFNVYGLLGRDRMKASHPSRKMEQAQLCWFYDHARMRARSRNCSKMGHKMPIIQHPACTEPAPDAFICRFMDFHKFRDLFANEELYFRRTDLFKETDPSEALPSDEYVRAACGLRKYHLGDERALNNNQAFARQNSEAYFISCWQLFEGETLDMWKTYGNGVAVFSRFDFLKSAIATILHDIFVHIFPYHH